MTHPGRRFAVKMKPEIRERLARERQEERTRNRADVARRLREAYERDRVAVGEEYARAVWLNW